MNNINKIGLLGWFLIISGILLKVPTETLAQIIYFGILVIYSSIFLTWKN